MIHHHTKFHLNRTNIRRDIAILKNAGPKAAKHWRRLKAAIEDNNPVQNGILLKCTKFKINRTNIRRDIAILSIATPGLYM